jgi:uncharacterized protein YjbI with pentapeptide repeats
MTNFTGANLEGADLMKVNFEWANVKGTNFEGVKFREAHDFTFAHLSKVKTFT